MKKLKTYLYVLYQTYLILKLNKSLSKETDYSFVDIAYLKMRCIQPYLLTKYTPIVGMYIYVQSRFNCAGDLLLWLNEANERITKGEYLDSNFMKNKQNSKDISFDNFLIDSNEYGINITEFYFNLLEVLGKIQKNVNNVKGNELKTYYLRRLTLISTDIVKINEGLLLVTNTKA